MTLKRLAAHVEDVGQRLLTRAGLGQSESRIAADAQAYWADPKAKRWAGNSHWENSDAFGAQAGDLWARMGAEHVRMFDRGARAAEFTRPLERVVDWGCGGGANAVAFAPRCGEIIGVDISQTTLDECARQVAAHSETPFRPVQIDVDSPGAALEAIGGPVDAYLSFYVYELVPTPEYGLHLLRLAHEMLAPGGIAFVQVKYSTGRFSTRPRGRGYRRGLAQMASYPIPEFWQAAERIGFWPVCVELVPRNDLDERYAYYTLIKPS